MGGIGQCWAIFVKTVIIDQFFDLFPGLKQLELSLDPLLLLLALSLLQEGVGPAQNIVDASAPKEILLVVFG